MDFGRNDSPPVQHRIEFADETVVIDTLEDFQSNVNDVIEIFRPDFSAY